MEYTVVDIGDHTLTGMRCNCYNGKWKIDNISGHEVIVNYEKCLLSADKLASELHDLYEEGATKVTLIQWVPEHQKVVGKKILTIPRKKAVS